MSMDEVNRNHSATATPMYPLLDICAVAKVLTVTPRHIQRLVAERRIPFLKIGRFVRFDPAELNVWLEEQRVQVRSSRCGTNHSR
jgi:excisionase family DNA binding protein